MNGLHLSSFVLLPLAIACGGGDSSLPPNPGPERGAMAEGEGAARQPPAADSTEEPPVSRAPIAELDESSEALLEPDAEEEESDPSTLESRPPLVQDSCDAAGEASECQACVCRECSDALAECLDTPGCADILACAAESGCTGADCYCGDASPGRCLAGQGNGPCMGAFLDAPGGREPTLTNPSGGPAADAASDVADCATRARACEGVCDFD